jgi:uncharacterized membrane protein
MVSFTKFLALAAVALAAPTADADVNANGLVNADVNANVGGLVNADADVHILPFNGGYPTPGYPGNGYPGGGYPGGGYPGYPGRRGGLLDLDLDLGILNGYGRGGLLDLNLGLGLLNGLLGGHGYPGRY